MLKTFRYYMGKLNIHCPHFSVCSGCIFDKDIDQPEILNRARIFFAGFGVKIFLLHCGDPIGWRTRAKVAVRGTVEKPIIGLFKKGSHQAANIPHCRVHHPAINQAISEVKDWITEHGIRPYDETTFQGMLRYIQLTVERKTSKVQLVLVFNETVSQNHTEMVEFLWKRRPELWHSIWVNENTRKDNVIFGPIWQLLFGERWLVETVRN